MLIPELLDGFNPRLALRARRTLDASKERPVDNEFQSAPRAAREANVALARFWLSDSLFQSAPRAAREANNVRSNDPQRVHVSIRASRCARGEQKALAPATLLKLFQSAPRAAREANGASRRR